MLEFHHLSTDVLSVFENHFAYVTFWINASTCNETTDLSTITVYTRTNSGSLEYDGTVTYYKESCTVRPTRCLRCSTPSGPVELTRKVNRSHVQIEWEWDMKDTKFGNFTTIRKELKLNVSCKYIMYCHFTCLSIVAAFSLKINRFLSSRINYHRCCLFLFFFFSSLSALRDMNLSFAYSVFFFFYSSILQNKLGFLVWTKVLHAMSECILIPDFICLFTLFYL